MSALALTDFENETISPITNDRIRSYEPRVETYSYLSMVKELTEKIAGASTRRLPLFTFTAEGTLIKMKSPLMLRVSFEDGEVFVENDALRIFGNGPTLAEAVRVFCDDLAHCWLHYRSLNDDQIGGDAIELKQRYASLASAP